MNKKIFLTILFALTGVMANAQLLYKISGKGLTVPSYIVGTYHFANVAFVDSIPGIRQAMEDCQQVYGELLMGEMADADSLALIQQAMMLPDSLTIDKLLSADEMNRLNVYMKSQLGVDMTHPQLAQLGRMKPSALSEMLTSLICIKKGGSIDAQNGFDDYFQKDARAHGKDVGALETLAFQIKLLTDGASLERQKELLMCLVDHSAFMEEMMEGIIRAFYSQDLEAVKDAMDMKLNNSCDSSPEEVAELVDKRNADWLTKMPALMAQKPTLFAVGAGHLPGENGVLSLLRQSGYHVEPVYGQSHH